MRIVIDAMRNPLSFFFVQLATSTIAEFCSGWAAFEPLKRGSLHTTSKESCPHNSDLATDSSPQPLPCMDSVRSQISGRPFLLARLSEEALLNLLVYSTGIVLLTSRTIRHRPKTCVSLVAAWSAACYAYPPASVRAQFTAPSETSGSETEVKHV